MGSCFSSSPVVLTVVFVLASYQQQEVVLALSVHSSVVLIFSSRHSHQVDNPAGLLSSPRSRSSCKETSPIGELLLTRKSEHGCACLVPCPDAAEPLRPKERSSRQADGYLDRRSRHPSALTCGTTHGLSVDGQCYGQRNSPQGFNGMRCFLWSSLWQRLRGSGRILQLPLYCRSNKVFIAS